MTNAQSWQTIDCVFRNLHFELSVDYMPDSKIWRVLKFVRCADVRYKLLRLWVHSRKVQFSKIVYNVS